MSSSVIKRPVFNDDSTCTKTALEQRECEKQAKNCYDAYFCENFSDDLLRQPLLLPAVHSAFLLRSIDHLSVSYESLDASGPWIVYWILHSLELLGDEVGHDKSSKIARFLDACQCKQGGFGGGPDQIPHLATSYAATCALCILGSVESFEIINRVGMRDFLSHCLQKDGSFIVHEGGEVDIRGLYCALAVCHLLNIKLSSGTAALCSKWLAGCQTFEGGFGAVPDCEAHGGYAFCGAASYVFLLDSSSDDSADSKEINDEVKQSLAPINVERLLRWTCNKQVSYEGGFQGRTNKLVDACYSYWQGAVFPILSSLIQKLGRRPDRCTFHAEALQQYLLICCQKSNGGLIDKPGKGRDLYHTCYALSGLSIVQEIEQSSPHNNFNPMEISDGFDQLVRTDPLLNVTYEAAEKMKRFFASKDSLTL